MRIKAATGLESQLEIYIRDIADPTIPLTQRVEAGKFLARLGELDGQHLGGLPAAPVSHHAQHRRRRGTSWMSRPAHHRRHGDPGMNLLSRWWNRRRREIDVQVLWPQCLRQAGSREVAKRAFRTHMELDPAYSDMSDDEKDMFLETLP